MSGRRCRGAGAGWLLYEGMAATGLLLVLLRVTKSGSGLIPTGPRGPVDRLEAYMSFVFYIHFVLPSVRMLYSFRGRKGYGHCQG